RAVCDDLSVSRFAARSCRCQCAPNESGGALSRQRGVVQLRIGDDPQPAQRGEPDGPTATAEPGAGIGAAGVAVAGGAARTGRAVVVFAAGVSDVYEEPVAGAAPGGAADQ